MSNPVDRSCTSPVQKMLSLGALAAVLLLAAALCLGQGVQSAYATTTYKGVTVGDFTYDIYDDGSGSDHYGSVWVMKYSGTATQIVLPTSVTYKGATYKTPKSEFSIQGNVFKGNTKVQKIAIPEGYDIMRGAFAGCTGLTEVAIDDNVPYIGTYDGGDGSSTVGAFSGCPNLKTYRINGTNMPSIDVLTHSGIGQDYNGNIYPGVTVYTVKGSMVDAYIKKINADSKNGNTIKLVYQDDPYSKHTVRPVVTVKASISKAAISGVANKSYTGKAVTQSPTVKLGGKTLKAGTDYTLSYKNNVNVGTATVTITGKGDYKDSVSKTFKIKQWKRLAGSNALATMERITKEYGKASVAVVSTNALAAKGVDAGYKDALAAAALAGGYGAPMLTTSKGGLANKTRSELKRMGVKTVYLVGSTNEVAAKVDAQIKAMGIKVTRIAGASASARAVNCSKQVKGRSGTVIIATQNNFKDALAISSYAYATKSPILYAEANKKLSAATVAYIKSAKFSKAIIVGGPVALPASIEGQLKGAGIAANSISRLAGSNQYKTAQVIAEWATGKLKNGTGGGKDAKSLYYYASVKFQPAVKLSANKLGVARADDNNIGWKDALAGAALCGKNRSVLLLADAKNSAQAEAFVKASKAQISMGYVLGGTLAVPAAAMTKLEKASL